MYPKIEPNNNVFLINILPSKNKLKTTCCSSSLGSFEADAEFGSVYFRFVTLGCYFAKFAPSFAFVDLVTMKWFGDPTLGARRKPRYFP